MSSKQSTKQQNTAKAVPKKQKPSQKAPGFKLTPGMGMATAKMSQAVVERSRGMTTQKSLLLASFALPSECQPQRVATGLRTIETSILKLESTLARVQGVFNGFDIHNLGSGNGFLVQRNDALAAFVYPSFPTAISAASSDSASNFGFVMIGTPGNSQVYNYWVGVTDGIPRQMPILYRNNAYSGFVGTLDVFQKVYSQTIDGKRTSPRWMWFDDLTTLTWRVSFDSDIIAVTESVTFELTTFRYDGAVENKHNTQIFTLVGSGVAGQVHDFPVPVYDSWYRFELSVHCFVTATGAQGAIGTFEVNCQTYRLTSNAQVMNFKPMNQLELHVTDIQSFRTPAAAVLMSNVTPMLDIGGDISCVQTAAGEGFFPLLRGNKTTLTLSGSPFDNVAQVKQAYKGKAAEGCHAWLKPASLVSLANLVSTFTTNNAGTLIDSWGPIDSEDGDLVYAWASPPSKPQQFEVRITHHLEFVTRSQWYEARMQNMKALVYESVVDELGSLVQFTENPEHTKLFNDARALVSGLGNAVTGLPSAVIATSDDYLRMLQHVRKNATKFSPRLGALLSALLG